MATSRKDYDFPAIEPHWQEYWAREGTFRAEDFRDQPTFYVLDMFPYPSGAGLHIGHPEGYTASDALKRFKKARGHNVLHPMGWDAFGLPTEQYAIKTGTHPAETTTRNVERFRKQLTGLGFAYDWNREINTTDPGYFRWTQWIFRELFLRGLAYVDEKPVWFCPELGTVLANEEVLNTPEGPRSERGSHPVERRPIRQWVLRITAYAEKLIDGLAGLDWPDSTKRLQENWIGRSEGAEVTFDLAGFDARVTVFTTRPDTLFGATYMVIAPEHPLVEQITSEEQLDAVRNYVERAKRKSDLERAELSKQKTGVWTGAHAVNPVNGREIPVWVADYVLMSYGTGAIMAVPAHDERDFEFAQDFGIEIVPVIFPENHIGIYKGIRETADNKAGLPEWEPTDNATAIEISRIIAESDDAFGDYHDFHRGKVAYPGKGTLFNSGEFTGLDSDEAKKRIVEKLAAADRGRETVNYKLRDWLFSRQRYWGEPFPIVWVAADDYERVADRLKCASGPVTCRMEDRTWYAVALPDSELPLELPEVESYQPSPDGQSPLSKARDWLQVKLDPATGTVHPPAADGAGLVQARRETNTMPQWAGSCWYYLRFIDPHNGAALVDPQKEKYWGTPDLYIGGAEHAVLHLLYARFWHRFLHEIGVVSQPEPFRRLFHQGIILGEDGEKMSKSRGNVVNPDTIVEQYGADALRLYLMFLGPLEAMKPWNTRNIEGIARFLRKVWRLFVAADGEASAAIGKTDELDAEPARILNETIRDVTADYDKLAFNTAISQLMICLNALTKLEALPRTAAEDFLRLLAPLAPHIAEELWERLDNRPSIAAAGWPEVDESKLVQDTVKIIFQVNGKVRGDAMLPADVTEHDAVAAARANEKVAAFIEGKTVRREIYVPGRIVNIVAN